MGVIGFGGIEGGNTADNDAGGGLSVRAVKINHGDMFSVAYVMSECQGPAKVDMARASALGIKGVAVGQLLREGQCTLADGQVMLKEQVTTPGAAGRTFAFLGDTCDASELIRRVKQVDVLVHEATFDADHAELAKERCHSTSVMAGDLARQLRAKILLLTHFSARYLGSREVKTTQHLLQEAQAVSAS